MNRNDRRPAPPGTPRNATHPAHPTNRPETDPENTRINHAATVRARAVEAMNHVSGPPAGFAADPKAWLAELEAGQFTPAQVAYLQNPTALAQYADGAAGARAAGDVEGADLADKILAVWRAWLTDNPAPLNPSNPFGA